MKNGPILSLVIGAVIGAGAGYGFTSYANKNSAESAPGAASIDGVTPESRADIAKAEELAGKNPKSFDAQMQAAQIQNTAKNYPEVLEHLTLATQIRPDLVEPVVALGNVSLETGNYPKAEEYYVLALAKRPNDPEIRADLGNAFLYRDPPDTKRAITEYKRALQLDPRHQMALQNLIAAYSRSGQVKEARESLARLEQINPDSSRLALLRAEIENTQKKQDDAARPPLTSK